MRQFSKQEEVDMWRFLLKEIVDPLTGIIERDRIKAKGLTLWEKFRQEVSDTRTATSLRKRFSMRGFPTPQSVNFDIDSQVKLHYALAIPIEDNQLAELFENADIDLDEYSCIIRYKDRRPGGLELRPFFKNRRRKRAQAYDFEAESKRAALEDAILLNNNQNSEEMMIGDIKIEPIDFPGTSNNQVYESRFSSGDLQNEEAQHFLSTLQNSVDVSNTNMLNAFQQITPKVENDNSFNSQVKPTSRNNVPTDVDMSTYLECMNSLLKKVNSPHLADVLSKVEDAIRKSRQENTKISIDKVRMMTEASLAMMGF